MSVEKERERIKEVYPNSATWPNKVNKMSDEQVIAIYKRFQKEGKIR